MTSTSARNTAPAAGRDPMGGRARRSPRLGSATVIPSTILLAASILLGGPIPAVAQGVDASCELELGTDQGPGAVAHLQDSIAAGAGISNPDVSFVVGYSMTGAAPVICINTDEVNITEPLTEADEIPGDVADSVDILAVEEAFFLRYLPNRPEEEEALIEKRFCHTVGVEGHTDCFILFSVVAPEDPDDPEAPPDLGRVTVFTASVAALLAAELGLGVEEIPESVQASPGIASQVCPESANELSRRIREDGDAQCTAETVTESFINLVAGQL